MNRITTLTDDYTDGNIESVGALLVESMTGAELGYDTFNAQIDPLLSPLTRTALCPATS